MEKIYAINTIDQASLWLSDNTGKNWTKTEFVEYILQTGWHNGNSEGITLLASTPEWIMPGVGELPRISPDGRVSNSIVTDGLIRVNDAVLQSILNHGKASLTICTLVMDAPFVTIEHLRITYDELVKLSAIINSAKVNESTINDIQNSYRPHNSVGKLAVKAAIEIETKTKRRAIAKEVMELLQKWADDGTEPYTLSKSDKNKKAVHWMTDKAKSCIYTTDACEKTLEKWNKGRQ